jgi:hypothetical protein
MVTNSIENPVGTSIRSALPRILPSYGNVIVVSAIPDVGTVIVAALQRLVAAYRNRNCSTNS